MQAKRRLTFVKNLGILLFVLLIPFSVIASDFEKIITEDKLENGLKVYIVNNQINPKLCKATVTVNIGWDHDGQKKGIAHFLEHCLFLGSKKYSKEETLKLLSNCVYDSNAYTAAKRTCFHYTGFQGQLETFLDILSDAVKNPLFPKKLVQSEKEPVTHESQLKIENELDEYADLVHQFLMPNYDSRQKQRGTGTPEDIEKLTITDLKEFWDKYYIAENMAVTVESALPAEKTKEIIEKYFSDVRQNQTFVYPKLEISPLIPKEAKIMEFKSEHLTKPSIVFYFPIIPPENFNKDEFEKRLDKLTYFFDLPSGSSYYRLKNKEGNFVAESISCLYLYAECYWYLKITANPNEYTFKGLNSLKKSILETHLSLYNLEAPEKTILLLNKMHENDMKEQFNGLGCSSESYGSLSEICADAFENRKSIREFCEHQSYCNLTSKDLWITQQFISKSPILTCSYLPFSFKE